MIHTLERFAWPAESLGDALLTLAKFAKLPHQPTRLTVPGFVVESSPVANASRSLNLERWLEVAAERIGLESEAVVAPYSEIESLLRRAGPALIEINPRQTLVVLSASTRYLKVVAPDYSIRHIATGEVRDAMCQGAEAPHRQSIETLLTEVGLSGRAREKAREALLTKQLTDERIGGCRLLRAPGRGEVRWGYWLTVMIGTHVVEQACALATWSLLGWMTFSGRLEMGWLLAWMLLMACIVPFRLLSLAAGGHLSLEFSSSLRRRLLAGTLRLDPDRVRFEGTGGLLGRVLEAETLEQLALGGGLQSVLSVVELLLAASVLGSAASQWGGAAMLVVFVVLATGLTLVNLRRREAWTDSRLALTNDLVERMVGHRTTLAQESREQAAAETDQSLERYVDPSTRLDRSTVLLQSVIPRAWLLCGLAWLGPAFVSGDESVTRLAVSLGGLLLAKQGLQRLVDGLDRVTGAAVVWRRLRPFLAMPGRPEPPGDPNLAIARPVNGMLGRSPSGSIGNTTSQHELGSGFDLGPRKKPDASILIPDLLEDAAGKVLLETRDVSFRHANRSEPVLRGVDLAIFQNDRILLEGPSGGGKSTLAAVLAGARTPQAGVLLLQGLDRQTLGRAWRRRIVLAPQFHQNHVLMGTFLYNLLLGRAWPPSQADVEAAERLCRQLDLGPLIDRMPGGLLQMVGETGWQLSHGERSRLFLARALLQEADLVLLDETFSALDPETLSRTLPKILDLAPTLIVIAHP